jgi:hypothetical protein
MQIAALYAGHADFDLNPARRRTRRRRIRALPARAALHRHRPAQARPVGRHLGLQRREDAGEKVGKIPVPPKYQSKDFLKTDFWRLRGGLDVPKERWVSYPGCERGADGSLVIAWAGWNHLQQATAMAAYYLEMKDNEGWEPERLQPLLAGLLELVPWLEQWHNEVDPAYGERMGDVLPRLRQPTRRGRWASRWMTCGPGSRRFRRGVRSPRPGASLPAARVEWLAGCRRSID